MFYQESTKNVILTSKRRYLPTISDFRIFFKCFLSNKTLFIIRILIYFVIVINTFCTHTPVYPNLSYVLYPNPPNAMSHQFKHVVVRTKADPVMIISRSVFLYITKLDLL